MLSPLGALSKRNGIVTPAAILGIEGFVGNQLEVTAKFKKKIDGGDLDHFHHPEKLMGEMCKGTDEA